MLLRAQLTFGLQTSPSSCSRQSQQSQGLRVWLGTHERVIGAYSLLLVREVLRGLGSRANPGFVIPHLG